MTSRRAVARSASSSGQRARGRPGPDRCRRHGRRLRAAVLAHRCVRQDERQGPHRRLPRACGTRPLLATAPAAREALALLAGARRHPVVPCRADPEPPRRPRWTRGRSRGGLCGASSSSWPGTSGVASRSTAPMRSAFADSVVIVDPANDENNVAARIEAQERDAFIAAAKDALATITRWPGTARKGRDRSRPGRSCSARTSRSRRHEHLHRHL